jgi:hypothetical protein
MLLLRILLSDFSLENIEFILIFIGNFFFILIQVIVLLIFLLAVFIFFLKGRLWLLISHLLLRMHLFSLASLINAT